MLIGLTGSIASGKSTASRYLASLGAAVIDADRVGRDLASEPAVLAELARAFPGCLTPDGALDRRALADLVFAEPAARTELEAILHPRILARMRQETGALQAKRPHAPVVWDAALLFEAGFHPLTDTTLLITAPQEVRLARLMARDNCTREEGLRRMAAQWPEAKKAHLAATMIDNSGSVEQLHKALSQWYAQLLARQG